MLFDFVANETFNNAVKEFTISQIEEDVELMRSKIIVFLNFLLLAEGIPFFNNCSMGIWGVSVSVILSICKYYLFENNELKAVFQI